MPSRRREQLHTRAKEVAHRRLWRHSWTGSMIPVPPSRNRRLVPVPHPLRKLRLPRSQPPCQMGLASTWRQLWLPPPSLSQRAMHSVHWPLGAWRKCVSGWLTLFSYHSILTLSRSTELMVGHAAAPWIAYTLLGFALQLALLVHCRQTSDLGRTSACVVAARLCTRPRAHGSPSVCALQVSC